jgi:hypothetical protein
LDSRKQGEYAPAQHVLDPEPGSRDKRVGAYTATFAVTLRPLDLNNPADQEMLIRTLDPNGTADRDELIRTAIDLDKQFKATNRDLAAAGVQLVDYTTPNNIHFTVIADYGVKRTMVHYRFHTRRECEKARTIAQGHGLNAEECSQGPLQPPAINIK